MVKTIEWKNGAVVMLDQTKLPIEVVYKECTHYREVADCIRRLVIRGAPAIGIAAAMGIALAAQDIEAGSSEILIKKLDPVFDELLATRPTAVNIRWAVDRIKRFLDSRRGESTARLKALLVEEARTILEEDIRINRAIGEWGAQFIKDGDVVLTHCNAGSLATGGYGTATAPMLVAREQGKHFPWLRKKQTICQSARYRLAY